MTISHLLAVLLFSTLTLSACASPTQAPVAIPTHYQFIIQFRIPIDAPAQPDFVHQLSLDAGATLVFVRTLATGAQLYRVTSRIERTAFDALLHRLSMRPDVRYVEEDRVVQPAGTEQ